MSGFIRVGRPGEDDLADLLALAGISAPTYDHVGSTLAPQDWPERRPHVETRTLGRGRRCFDAAADGLRAWACHRGIHATVHPHDAPIEVGRDVLVVLAAGPVSITVPDRIVAVVDEPRRFGFAYGTLDGHQERGEEGFLVELLEDGSVRGTIRVDAVPATSPARLLGPAVLAVQHLAVRRYLAALRDHVRRVAPQEGTRP